MKPESLQALLIDRELNELPAEAAELLDAWLAEHPEAAAAAPPIRRTLETTRAAVRRFPELARPALNLVAFPTARLWPVALAVAASVLILVGGSLWVAFRLGQQSQQNTAAGTRPAPIAASGATSGKTAGPWARYGLASGPRGGLTVVRRDVQPQPGTSP